MSMPLSFPVSVDPTIWAATSPSPSSAISKPSPVLSALVEARSGDVAVAVLLEGDAVAVDGVADGDGDEVDVDGAGAVLVDVDALVVVGDNEEERMLPVTSPASISSTSIPSSRSSGFSGPLASKVEARTSKATPPGPVSSSSTPSAPASVKREASETKVSNPSSRR